MYTKHRRQRSRYGKIRKGGVVACENQGEVCFSMIRSHSIMALHILGKDENQVQFLVGAPISLLS